MRERLIEILKTAPLCGHIFEWEYSNGTIEKFADYLLENGVVVLPCKIGSTLYLVHQDTQRIYECKVIRISFYECYDEIQYWINGDSRYSNAAFSDIGKTVFLTRKEAEKALKK